MKPRLKVCDVNPHVKCTICDGYLVDATAIVECLHAFCRTCIVRYLESNHYCPVCDVQVHKTQPLLSIRSDQMLQDVVYKVVPELYQNEMRRRREFYAEHPEAADPEKLTPEDLGQGEPRFFSARELISLSLQHRPKEGKTLTHVQDSATRHLSCPAAFTVAHLIKFVRLKFSLSNTLMVELFYEDQPLRHDYTLMDVAYIYSWKRAEPMRFFFSVSKNPPPASTFLLRPETRPTDVQQRPPYNSVKVDLPHNGFRLKFVHDPDVLLSSKKRHHRHHHHRRPKATRKEHELTPSKAPPPTIIEAEKPCEKEQTKVKDREKEQTGHLATDLVVCSNKLIRPVESPTENKHQQSTLDKQWQSEVFESKKDENYQEIEMEKEKESASQSKTTDKMADGSPPDDAKESDCGSLPNDAKESDHGSAPFDNTKESDRGSLLPDNARESDHGSLPPDITKKSDHVSPPDDTKESDHQSPLPDDSKESDHQSPLPDDSKESDCRSPPHDSKESDCRSPLPDNSKESDCRSPPPDDSKVSDCRSPLPDDSKKSDCRSPLPDVPSRNNRLGEESSRNDAISAEFSDDDGCQADLVVDEGGKEDEDLRKKIEAIAEADDEADSGRASDMSCGPEVHSPKEEKTVAAPRQQSNKSSIDHVIQQLYLRGCSKRPKKEEGGGAGALDLSTIPCGTARKEQHHRARAAVANPVLDTKHRQQTYMPAPKHQPQHTACAPAPRQPLHHPSILQAQLMSKQTPRPYVPPSYSYRFGGVQGMFSNMLPYSSVVPLRKDFLHSRMPFAPQPPRDVSRHPSPLRHVCRTTIPKQQKNLLQDAPGKGILKQQSSLREVPGTAILKQQSSLRDVCKTPDVPVTGQTSLRDVCRMTDLPVTGISKQTSLRDASRTSDLPVTGISKQTSLRDTCRTSDLPVSGISKQTLLGEVYRTSTDLPVMGISKQTLLRDVCRTSDVSETGNSKQTSLRDVYRTSDMPITGSPKQTSLRDVYKMSDMPMTGSPKQTSLRDTCSQSLHLPSPNNHVVQKRSGGGGRGGGKYRRTLSGGAQLAVFNPDPNKYSKLVIKKMDG